MEENKIKNTLNIIRKAKENDRLVLFVGSGVSINSGVPSWGNMVGKMADELNIEEESFSQSDFLKIPELLKHVNIEKYSEIVNDCLTGEYIPNVLDDIITKMKPTHIITTNFDNLIEKSLILNDLSEYYGVIKNDKDLIENDQGSKNYLIKMHGSIENNKIDINNIVLNEKSYLNYEYDHPVISSFVKSLLTNHLFLFIGYSMNDNNIKLIINWINHFRDKYNGNNEYFKNVMLLNPFDDQVYSDELAEDYFSLNNIDVINLNELPEELNYYSLEEKNFPFYSFGGAVETVRNSYGLNQNPTIYETLNNDYQELYVEKLKSDKYFGHVNPIFKVLYYINNTEYKLTKSELCEFINERKYISINEIKDVIIPSLSYYYYNDITFDKSGNILVNSKVYKDLISNELFIKKILNNKSESFTIVNKDNKEKHDIYNQIEEDRLFKSFINNEYGSLIDIEKNNGYKRLLEMDFYNPSNNSNHKLSFSNIVNINNECGYYSVNNINDTVMKKKYKYLFNVINNTNMNISTLKNKINANKQSYKGDIIEFGFGTKYYNLDLYILLFHDLFKYSILNRLTINKNTELYELYFKMILTTYINSTNSVKYNEFESKYNLDEIDLSILLNKIDIQAIFELMNDYSVDKIVLKNEKIFLTSIKNYGKFMRSSKDDKFIKKYVYLINKIDFKDQGIYRESIKLLSSIIRSHGNKKEISNIFFNSMIYSNDSTIVNETLKILIDIDFFDDNLKAGGLVSLGKYSVQLNSNMIDYIKSYLNYYINGEAKDNHYMMFCTFCYLFNPKEVDDKYILKLINFLIEKAPLFVINLHQNDFIDKNLASVVVNRSIKFINKKVNDNSFNINNEFVFENVILLFYLLTAFDNIKVEEKDFSNQILQQYDVLKYCLNNECFDPNTIDIQKDIWKNVLSVDIEYNNCKAVNVLKNKINKRHFYYLKKDFHNNNLDYKLSLILSHILY